MEPNGLDCVCLNNAGDGVDSIDHDCNANQCSGIDANGNLNGGYWIPGTVANNSSVTNIDQNNNQIGASANLTTVRSAAISTVPVLATGLLAWQFPTRRKEAEGHPAAAPRSGVCFNGDDQAGAVDAFPRAATDSLPADLPPSAGSSGGRNRGADRAFGRLS